MKATLSIAVLAILAGAASAQANAFRDGNVARVLQELPRQGWTCGYDAHNPYRRVCTRREAQRKTPTKR